MNSSQIHLSPKARPLPQFFADNATFSTKKEKETPKLIEHFNYPPRPPIKSCPPISRLRPQRKHEHDGAKVISFLNKNNPNEKSSCNLILHNDSDLLRKHYDEKRHNLFFEQCFIIEGNLGCGSFGKVYKVKSKEDGKYYAVKKSREKFKGNSDRSRKLEEVAKHEELPPHPNFVKFFRAWEEKQRLYIQTELCQMSLSAYAEKHHNIPESDIWNFLVDLLQAVKHLHDRRLVHMDIKPDNIFISFDGYCKLGDFGLVIDLQKNDLKEVQEGDPKYLAPEILKSSNNISCAADIFSLGMSILELATDLDLPRGGEPWHQLRNGQIPEDLVSSLSEDLVEIIMRMIEPDHLKRGTVDQLLSMPKIRFLIAKRRGKYFLRNFYKLAINFAYFIASTASIITHPLVKLSKMVYKFVGLRITEGYERLQSRSVTSGNGNSHCVEYHGGNANHDHSVNENNAEKKTTSTPKKSELVNNLPLNLININDDDDYDVDDENEKSFNMLNDSMNLHNNSYLNPLFDSSSSSSDNSDYASANKYRTRKVKTEPQLNKTKTLHIPKFEMSPTSTSPTTVAGAGVVGGGRTPPCVKHAETKELTPLNFTRQRLVFDDDDENEKKKNNNNENVNVNVNTRVSGEAESETTENVVKLASGNESRRRSRHQPRSRSILIDQHQISTVNNISIKTIN